MPLVWVVFVLGYYANECGGEVWAQKSRSEISEAAFCMAIESIEELHSFFFDSCFFTGKGTQIIQLGAAYFTDFVHCNVFDER